MPSFTLLLFLIWLNNTHVKHPTPKQTIARLGKLEIKVTRIEHRLAIADSFTGPSQYAEWIDIYVTIKNVGGSPACSALIPSIEEYKGLELWRTDSVKPEYVRVPKVRNLAPGKAISGSYTFEPEPVKRKYILVIEQRSASQSCTNARKDEKRLNSSSQLVRIPLESIDQK